MDDDACDGMGHGAWMTYDELAASRGFTRRAAVRLTQRQRLRRQPGNDGQVRVWVPADMAKPSQRSSHRDNAGDDARDTGLTAGALVALEAAVAALTARADAADQRADAERARADAERVRGDAAERLLGQTIGAHNRIAIEVETLREAERARRAAGRLARVKAAWRGE